MNHPSDTDGAAAARIDYAKEAPRELGALVRFGTSGLEEKIAHLAAMRASRLNGCAFCLDMHWKDARAAGEARAAAGDRR